MKQCVLLLLTVALLGCGNFIDWNQSKKGMRASEPIIHLIESYHQSNGRYPKSLGDLSLTDVDKSNITDIGIKYRAWDNDSFYSISFRLWAPPLHPWCGYGSTTKSWQCLGK